MPATALLLGSMVVAAGLVIRTIMEEKTLMRELEGYPEYAQHVRYRLIPFVW
jgi:protein-S-isoprenylcysteine O-methyltransferase Ste14